MNKKGPHNYSATRSKFQQHVQILNNWKTHSDQQIKNSLNYFLKAHEFKSLAQHNDFTKDLTQFHKQISKSEDNKQAICQQFFQLTRLLRKKIKQLQNQGYVKMQKDIKSKVIKVNQSFRNLVDVTIQYPNQLLSRKNVFQTQMTSTLYRAFVTFYPEAHQNVPLNIKTVKFIRNLFDELERKYYSYINKNYFIRQLDKICVKFQKIKYLQNKKKMLMGQITVADIIQNRKNAFQNIGAKQTQKQNLLQILKESEGLKQKNQVKEQDISKTKVEQKQNLNHNQGDSDDQKREPNQSC